MGRVEHLHVARAAGAQPEARDAVEAVAGIGLLGDRYAAGAGFWRDGRVSRDLTLIAAETLDELAERSGIALAPGEARRNVTTRGVDLDALLGRPFWLGDVLALGTDPCEPCRHLEEVTGKRLLRPLVHRGGLRARLLTSGTVRRGDAIEPADAQEGVGVVVTRGRRVLLGRRLSRHGSGTWSFPGGKPEPGESAFACALRELREETGLRARDGRLVGETLDGFPESRAVFRTRFVLVDGVAGTPRACEPEKTAAWRWFDWRRLPAPLFAPVASLVATGFDLDA